MIRRFIFPSIGFLLLPTLFSCATPQQPTVKIKRTEASPCYQSINNLRISYGSNYSFRSLIDSAFRNVKELPLDKYPKGNPWMGKSFPHLVNFLIDWCTFLPTIEGTSDTGLRYIQEFAFLYYQNPKGVQFVRQEPGKGIMQKFARERGAFMDSPDSKKHLAQWLADPRIEKEDYHLPDPTARDGGFQSFNQFFARTLKDRDKSRPQTMPERDYVITAPTDCIMNSIPQKIEDGETLISTKGRQALNIKELLRGSPHSEKFIGGTALSCVLMPNTYHHYHSPLTGRIVESRIVKDSYYGYNDFPKWVPPNGNVGYYGTDFSEFENFKRGYFIVDTGKFGYAAFVPVGLNTISSIVFEEKFRNIGSEGVLVKRGDRLGHFLYGGSLFIMIFEEGRYKSDAIQVRLGNQIGTFDTK